mmetsp:Transcript_30344/g.97692  ORF Transcript_30344/g.97692 Transcript_30344/m.97692 type:complete len:201 (-) Transcript_30344:85-687(-)
MPMPMLIIFLMRFSKCCDSRDVCLVSGKSFKSGRLFYSTCKRFDHSRGMYDLFGVCLSPILLRSLSPPVPSSRYLPCGHPLSPLLCWAHLVMQVASIVDAALAARWTRPGSKEHITPLTPRLCAILVIGFLLAGAISVPPLCRAALKDMMNSDSMIIGGVGSPQGLSPNLLWKRAGQNESAELNLSSLSSSNSSCLSEEK